MDSMTRDQDGQRDLSAAFVVALAQHPEAQRKLRQHIVSEDVGEQAP
jgi:hypothetical protein